ncbi:peptidase inhibitor family I36 protein [Nonomuraea sp. B12E4]|uniref:peptidase inhibitor family I36 protein n=1 Tax=Nonomuraea sp. B12E4 TaxID=3153564 RepID=UPI00325F46D5
MPEPLRRTALALAVATAGLVLPATAARADPPLPCPRIEGVCVWMGKAGRGELWILHEARHALLPPVLSAQNQTGSPWCFFEQPIYKGRTRTVAAGETVHRLGFHSASARPGACGVAL